MKCKELTGMLEPDSHPSLPRTSASLVVCLRATVFCAALAYATAAQSDPDKDASTDSSFEFYGQISPTFQYVDDGVESFDNVVDNDHSNSRIGLLYTKPLAQGEFTFNFETSLGFPKTSGVSQIEGPRGVDWDREELRKVDFTLSGPWGKVYFGQGSMASDSVADFDFSNTSLTTYNGIGDTAGSFEFRAPDGTLSGIPIGAVFPSLDGARRGRIRYDTPSYNGLTFSVAAGEDILSFDVDAKFYDAALRYNREIWTVKFNAAVAYSRRDGEIFDSNTTFGSLAALFDNGVNVAFAAGSRDEGGDYFYLKLGYRVKAFDFGETSVAVDYYDGEDFALNGRDSKSYGFGINQQIESLNTQVYLGYRRYELEDPTVSYEDIDSFLLGARWRF